MIFAIQEDALTQLAVLTIMSSIIPLTQYLILLKVKLSHPSIADDGKSTLQTLENTKTNFKKMTTSLLTNAPPKHHQAIIKWLSIQEINANNYSQDDRNKCMGSKDAAELSKVDGRSAFIVPFDSKTLIAASQSDAQDQKSSGKSTKPFETHMMKIINHHVRMVSTVARLEQLNLGMKVGQETALKEKRLPWTGVVTALRNIGDKPSLPSALNYSVVRGLKDKKDWNYAEMGTRLDPQTLSEKPWPQIRQNANSYIDSFLKDVFFHWFNIWFFLVMIKVAFA
jgi:hypothetical protein